MRAACSKASSRHLRPVLFNVLVPECLGKRPIAAQRPEVARRIAEPVSSTTFPNRYQVVLVRRAKFDKAAVLADHAGDVAGPFECIGELQVHCHLAGQELGSSVQLGDHIARTADGEQAHAGKQPRGPERRVQPLGGSELRERRLVLAPLLKHDPEVMVDERSLAALRHHIRKARSAVFKSTSSGAVHTFRG